VYVTPGPHHRLLHRVLGLEARAQDPAAVAPQLLAGGGEGLLEGAPLGRTSSGVGVRRDGVAAGHSAARVLSVSHPAVPSTVSPARTARWPVAVPRSSHGSWMERTTWVSGT